MKKNIFLLLGSILFFISLLLLGEIFCRIFLNINIVGSSKNSFTPKAYGLSHGNAKNIIAEAFGVKVYTDEYGFRIDPDNLDKENYGSAIALIGDSVPFGVGVEEDKTIAGLLRKKFDDIKIYNTSVSGYRVTDYKNIVTEFVLKTDGIKKVFLFFCLNDISYTPIVADDEIQVDDARLKGTGRFFNFLARINKLLSINKHLRHRSHLYHLIKSIVANPSKSYFLYDLQYYSKSNPLIEDDMKIMAEINKLLRNKNIEFKVLILPYKIQLEDERPEFMVPQKMLSQYFKTNKIDYIDLFNDFKTTNKKPGKLYLFGDPLHLSATGHKVVFDVISKQIVRN